MHDDQPDLLEDLGILAVARHGDDLVVSLYGGRTNVCGTVRFTFLDRRQRSRHLATLRRWARSGAVVSLLRRGRQLSLFVADSRISHPELPAS